MNLNHINLVVENVAEATGFFEKYFDFKCTEVKGDHIIAILKGSDDFTLVLMTNKEPEKSYPANFHIGFMQESMEAVTTTFNKLKGGGIALNGEPGKMRNTFGFYFLFQNVMIEVGT